MYVAKIISCDYINYNTKLTLMELEEVHVTFG